MSDPDCKWLLLVRLIHKATCIFSTLVHDMTEPEARVALGRLSAQEDNRKLEHAIKKALHETWGDI